MKHARFVLCLLMGWGAVGTGASQDPASAPPELLDQLARAEAKWQASKTEAYEFRFQHACNGLIAPPPSDVPPGALIRVKGGASMYLRPGAVAIPVAAELVQYSTVEHLFAVIRKASTSRPFSMEAQYDQARGYPTRVCVNPAATVSDDEFGFLITDFKVVSNVGD